MHQSEEALSTSTSTIRFEDALGAVGFDVGRLRDEDIEFLEQEFDSSIEAGESETASLVHACGYVLEATRWDGGPMPDCETDPVLERERTRGQNEAAQNRHTNERARWRAGLVALEELERVLTS